MVCIRACIPHGCSLGSRGIDSKLGCHGKPGRQLDSAPAAQATALSVCPAVPGATAAARATFLVGTKSGAVHRGAVSGAADRQTYRLIEARSPERGGPEDPRVAEWPEVGAPIGSAAVHIAAHRELPGVFAVILDLGCVAVFCVERRTPACMWTCRRDAVAAVWLPGAPSLLAVASAAGVVTLYDVVKDPCEHQPVQVAVPLRDGCSCIAAVLSGGEGRGDARSGHGKASSGTDGTSDAERPAALVLVQSDGSCTVHVLDGHSRGSAEADAVHEHLLLAA